ncbi:MAG: tetratricopeptide repeat protein [Thermoflexales bacterium]|nr:tetratricopeptide repeat protein [Thermoflexales bacterium]
MKSVKPAVFGVGLLLLALLAACGPSPTPLSVTSPAATRDPFPALLALGDAHAEGRERTAAEAAYRQAASLRPDDPTPYLRLARLYRDWNRPQEGLDALARAGERGADLGEVASLRAAFYAAQGDWERAVAEGEQALALRDDPATWHLLVRGYLQREREEEARDACQALVERDPADVQARECLGFLLALTDPEAARPHLQAAATPFARAGLTALEEKDEVARLARLGQAALAHGEPALAVLALRRAVAMNPNFADARALLGHALEEMGRLEGARVQLETAVRLAPDSPLARSLLGLHFLNRGDPDAARPHLEAAYDRDPQNPAFALYLGLLYADLGQYAVADIWLAEATRLAPEDPHIWEAVARFYLDRFPGDARGVTAARALVRLAPDAASAHALLGQALLFAEDYAGAEEALCRTLELAPDLAVAHYDLGRLYALRGRREAARAEFTRALDLNTDPGLREEIEEALGGNR